MNQESEMSQEDLKLRARLQQAVRAEEVPPFLETRIRQHIRSSERTAGVPWHRGWTMAIAALVVVAGTGIAYQLGHLRFTAASQESYIVSVSNRLASIMKVGLSDHIHCAYFARPEKTPPSMETFVHDMGPSYAGLIPVVRKHVPERYRLEAAHQCKYHGRRFVHIVLKDDSQLMSLVIAKKVPGESFDAAGLLPALTQSGLPFYRAGAKKFEIASFESRDHLIYLVSDLPGQRNMDQLLALAPDVRSELAKAEL
jgi:hypothetical protein